jgi:hypothetical protein
MKKEEMFIRVPTIRSNTGIISTNKEVFLHLGKECKGCIFDSHFGTSEGSTCLMPKNLYSINCDEHIFKFEKPVGFLEMVEGCFAEVLKEHAEYLDLFEKDILPQTSILWNHDKDFPHIHTGQPVTTGPPKTKHKLLKKLSVKILMDSGFHINGVDLLAHKFGVYPEIEWTVENENWMDEKTLLWLKENGFIEEIKTVVDCIKNKLGKYQKRFREYPSKIYIGLKEVDSIESDDCFYNMLKMLGIEIIQVKEESYLEVGP